MIPKRLLKKLDERDGHRSVWTGIESDTLVPHHRVNRGMGGRPSLDRLSNLVWLEADINGFLESDAGYATEARRRGIKLSSHADPALVPVEFPDGLFWLTDDGRRVPAGQEPSF